MGKGEEKLLGVGIDISKGSLEVALAYEGMSQQQSYPNTDEGIQGLLESLEGVEGTYKIVMESTGRYHFLVALRLSEAGLDVRVINPLLAKRHFSSRIRKVKTDKADARVLAQMAIQEKDLPKCFSPDKRAIQIRQKMGLMASLEKQLQALNAMMGNYQTFQTDLGIETSEAELGLATTIKSLSKFCDQLEGEINDLVLQQTSRLQPCHNLQTIPGIAHSLAALLSQMLDATCTHPKQWIAYLGMDISVNQSGKWTGPGKLTKRGNPYLRKRLYSAAWGAVMNYPDFKAYYQQLRQQSRSHVESLLIIARKLLRIAFVVVRQNIPYDPKLAFPS